MVTNNWKVRTIKFLRENIWIVISIILLISIIGFMSKDFGGYFNLKEKERQEQSKINIQEELIRTSNFPIQYSNCLSACEGIYDDGEEMTLACKEIREDEKVGLDNMHVSRCSYLGSTYFCNCTKEEEKCLEEMFDYLKDIRCV